MSAKRRKQLMRQGYRDFYPDSIPKYLQYPIGSYDYECYKEGWMKASAEYKSNERRKEEENKGPSFLTTTYRKFKDKYCPMINYKS